MDYEIVITPEAENDFYAYMNYLLYKEKNPLAARNFISDFEKTKNRLALVAGNLKLCDDSHLHKLGFRRINFSKMNYFLLYRVENHTVLIYKIFHSLQDYENITE